LNNASPKERQFKALADDGKVYLLTYDERNDEWALEKVYEY